ncbi:MAG: universal stress protein [Actinomycetota bacterium]|nr:universal stress protein [Actinomycetota bacterium]MDQ2956794.1 universal stress protein [Actinomycetota bacterium]
MGAYQAIVVGTDGSDSSLRAIDRAAGLAHDAGAKLVIVCAYRPTDPADTVADRDALGSEGYQLVGSAPAEDILRRAEGRAARAGASSIDSVSVDGSPVQAILQAAKDSSADLIVVGNRGLNRLGGRLLGSVPSDVARRADIDVLIVHTT